ncbi:Metallo-dependent phosphatase [Jackrogersella minutella]|nr:Metallo-dependent phosphatase [Jackrogersella minutella]
MGRLELPSLRTQQRNQQRRKLGTVGIITTILTVVLLCYTRYNDRSLFSTRPFEEFQHSEFSMAHDTPSLLDPPLLATLPSSALPKPHGGSDSPRLIIIGDVHGQLSALDALLTKVKFSSSRGDQVIFTGDMVNKGPNSAGVVDRLIAINAWAVRGNHEDRVLRAWTKIHKRKHLKVDAEDGSLDVEDDEGEEIEAEDEEREGGQEGDDLKATKLSKSSALDRSTARSLNAAQLTWLAKLPVILRLGTVSPYYGDVVVVHAGLVPGVPLKEQNPWAAMNMRTLITHSIASTDSPPLDSSSHHKKFKPSEGREGHPWSKVWNEFEKEKAKQKNGGEKTTVVYGHDAKTGLSIRRYAFGLDSSCIKGGDLTALIFESTPTRRKQDVDEEPAEVIDAGAEEQAKHGITHRIVSVSCKPPGSDDDKKGKKKKKGKGKGDKKHKAKEESY